ncbi:YgjP-like metallopeptidase domain-containing protein [Streptomyces sp. NPDC012473]|uniref:YgjP-like metallopeptidase domain-containing protein n=1 Tax=Streptomyces sp. NPDC012473 TaxID=3156676 RepID=UPI0033FAEF6A
MSPLPEQIAAALSESGILEGFTVHVRVSSRRRTWGITVEPGGTTLTLHAPATARPEDSVTFVRRVRHRIGRASNKARTCAPEHPVKDLANGESYYWLGRPSRLRLLDGAGSPVERWLDSAASPVERVNTGHGWWLHVDRDAVAAHGNRPLIRWYCTQGAAWLEKEAPSRWSRMAGRAPLPQLHVADIGRRRWGKYEPERHRVTLAWQTLQMPLPFARHVVVHELAHAMKPRGAAHGPEFWRLMERTIPGAREERRRLDDHGRTLWMGDIHSIRPTNT